MFYDELETFSRLHKYVCLLGDFNARTSCLSDITTVDILQQIGVSPESLFSTDVADQLKQYSLDIERVSQDVKVNEFGRNIVDFCKNNGAIILNGRAFHGKGMGKTTCKDKSVVDYALCSITLVEFLTHFDVLDFCPLFSDAHNAIELHLKVKHIPRNKPGDEKKSTIKSWEEHKKDLFVENIDKTKVQDLINKLNAVTIINKCEINSFMQEIENIFEHSKTMTFTSFTVKSPTSVTDSKDKAWFSHDCRSARKKYHLAKRMYKYNKTQENYQQLVNNSKNYKKEINKSIVKHKRETRKKIREMRQKSPNDYWKYINSLNKKTKNMI